MRAAGHHGGGVSFGGVRTSARPQRAERVPVCLGLPGGALAVRSPPGRGGGSHSANNATVSGRGSNLLKSDRPLVRLVYSDFPRGWATVRGCGATATSSHPRRGLRRHRRPPAQTSHIGELLALVYKTLLFESTSQIPQTTRRSLSLTLTLTHYIPSDRTPVGHSQLRSALPPPHHLYPRH